MRHNTIIIKILLLVICSSANAQSTIENVLAQINKNNKTILATAQYYHAQNLEFKTGLNPSNPTAEYDFLRGSPANAGNQHDFAITQQFDFPSAYIKRVQLAKTQIAKSEYEIISNRQDILLEAKKVCIALVYHNKLQAQLTQQKQNFEKLLASFQTKLDTGDGNILDVNKAKLQLVQIKKKFQENVSAISELNIKLAELNGGTEILFTDTVYFSPTSIPDFAQLESDYENADPLLKMLQQQKLISKKQLELSKSLWLPKMELGYHYQGILGQTYSGFHTGISVPLWENKNTVKQKKSQLLYSESQLIAHTNEHYFHIKHIFERYTNLKITLQEYQTIFGTLNNTTLLNKALALGEITTMQYLMEINFYTEAQSDFIQTEKEYHETIAELYKYLL
ncbi:MAG: TolC family protein [Bacteroidetes bacterium]|nr:TolC family protein [Bacteroidota bacterium]